MHELYNFKVFFKGSFYNLKFLLFIATDSSQTNIVKKPTTPITSTTISNENASNESEKATSASGSKSPKFFLGDDDSNSSDELEENKDTNVKKEPEVAIAAKPKLEAKIGGSWSMLKNASKTTTASSSSGSIADTAASSEKTNAVDSFQKYKMQLLEKEKMLREQETLKAQREKQQLNTK